MAVAYSQVYSWLANLPAQDLTDLMIAERAAYWGMTVPALTTMMLATGLYTTAVLPVAPTSPTAVAGTRQVTVGWSAVSGARSYNVKRATVTNSEVTLLAGAGVLSSPFVDTTSNTGTLYFYKVSAVDVLGEGPNSAEVSATPT